MSKTITDIAVEPTTTIQSLDLAKIAADEGGYQTFRVVPIGADGYRQSVEAEMVYHSDAGRAGIAWGANAQWTDASSPEDAAERFFGLNDKEMSN